jgi:Family of unknown function (DUF6194)
MLYVIDPMNEIQVDQYIMGVLEGVEVVVVSNDRFYFYGAERDQLQDRHFPFATLVTGDRHDQASKLERPDVFRLNVGVSSETYQAMFGSQPAFPRDGGVIETGHDFAALDQLLPHPIYASMSWVCVLNPSETTFERIKFLLQEAHQMAVESYVKRGQRQSH